MTIKPRPPYVFALDLDPTLGTTLRKPTARELLRPTPRGRRAARPNAEPTSLRRYLRR